MTIVTLTQAQINAGLRAPGFNLGVDQFTFSVPGAGAIWPGYAPGSEPFNSYAALNANQAAAFREAIALWDAIIAPDFREVIEVGDTVGEVRAAFSAIGGGGAYAYQGTPQTPGLRVGDIWLDRPLATGDFSRATGADKFTFFIHEIGHTLGLKHPLEPPLLPPDQRDQRFTVMSYNTSGVAVRFSQNGSTYTANSSAVAYVTPQVLDIAAIQGIYGAETRTRAGDTVYSFDQASTNLQSIYDAGGVDTLDLSNFTRVVEIDLRSGAFSSLGVFTRAEQIAFWSGIYPAVTQFITTKLNGESDLYTHRDNLGIAISTVIENAIGGAGADILVGNAVANRLVGGAGADRLDGAEGDDTLEGGEGADTLTGGVGTDTASFAGAARGLTIDLTANTASDGLAVDTFSGIEAVIGSAFADTVLGTAGADRAGAGGGGDLMRGEAGDDTLEGGAGDDLIEGGAGADSLDGGAGDDVIEGGVGADTLVGGTGFDTASWAGSARAVSIDLAGGAASDGQSLDTLVDFEAATGSAGADVMLGSVRGERFAGGGGNDTLRGEAGDDTLEGGDGDDLLAGGGDGDTLRGEAGDDRLEGGDGNDLLLSGVGADTLRGDAGDDTLRGEAGDDSLEGGDGRDLLSGGIGTDTLRGDAGDDTLEGGDGDDLLAGGAGADSHDGGAGVDTVSYADADRGVIVDLAVGAAWTGVFGETVRGIENAIGSGFADSFFGSDGANLIEGGAGADYLYGGGGIDTASWAGSASGVILDLAAQAAWDGTSGDRVIEFEVWVGSAHADLFFGSASGETMIGGGGGDTLRGEGGADMLRGEGGDDTLSGGDGDDLLAGGAGKDAHDGGAGVDTVSYADATQGVIVDLAVGAAWTGVFGETVTGIENAIGSAFADSFFGSGAPNRFEGGAGADYLYGGGDIDTASWAGSAAGVIVDLTAEAAWDGASLDRVVEFEVAIGSDNADTFFGGSGAETLIGGGGGDTLRGEGGADRLDGGAGADALTGGGGFDTFVLRRGEAAGDMITDFAGNGAAAGDRIELAGWSAGSTFVAVALSGGTQDWRITDGLSGLAETVRITGAIDAGDYFFG